MLKKQAQSWVWPVIGSQWVLGASSGPRFPQLLRGRVKADPACLCLLLVPLLCQRGLWPLEQVLGLEQASRGQTRGPDTAVPWAELVLTLLKGVKRFH